ncbi:MAG: PKD domain-containing protein [Nitrososphaerota archaeon]
MKNLKILALAIIIVLGIPPLTVSTLKPALGQSELILLKIVPDFYFAKALDEEFNLTITISGVNESQHLIGIHFRLLYRSDLLKVIDVFEGSFLRNYGNTFFAWNLEEDGFYGGPHVVVGSMILPNSTGQWPGPFPEGNGTVATIKFRVIYRPVEPNPIEVCVLRFAEVILLNDKGEEILDYGTGISLYQSPVPLRYPIPRFTFSPVIPSAGQEILFDASQSSDPDGKIVSYRWNFGDGTPILTTTEKKVVHIFTLPRTYNVTLTVIDSDGLTASAWNLVEVGAYNPVEVKVETGKVYNPKETAEFYISTSQLGMPINVSFEKVEIYYNGSLYADLSGSIQQIGDGLYWIQYTIPGDAKPGVYMLYVKAEYSGITGVGTASFQISSLLQEIGATLVRIEGTAVYINSTLGTLVVNVADIEATLVEINGTLAFINSTLGSIVADIADINATIVRLSGTVAQISSTVGSLVVPIEKINLTVTEIKGNMATIQTTLGTIRGYVENVDDGGLATINTELGTVKTNIATLLQRVPEKPPTVDITPSWIAAIFAILTFIIAIFLILVIKRK